MRAVLISCASKKRSHAAKAQDLYISTLFQLNLAYARTLKPDKIFILSAKYGLLPLERKIEPYNVTLNTMHSAEVATWADRVINDLKRELDLQKDTIIFLAGEKYRKYLIPHMQHYEIPLQGKGIGKQLKYLKEAL